jgi:hypothetical protein
MLLPAFGNAQDNNEARHRINLEIPEVALLSLISENGNNIRLQAISPTEAGSPIQNSNSQDENLWLNYSSIIINKNHSRKIVAMVQGEIPDGVQIKLEASEATGIGKGKKGTPAGTVTLSNKPSEIIVGIGSCYTGKGINNGHYLTYKLEIDENQYSQLSNQIGALDIVYTLTDQN